MTRDNHVFPATSSTRILNPSFVYLVTWHPLTWRAVSARPCGSDTSAAAGAFTQKISTAVGTARTRVTTSDPADVARVVAGVLVLGLAAYKYETTLQLAVGRCRLTPG